MSDDLIINLIWGVMELEQQFEDDPYSLSLKEIKILEHNENTKLASAQASFMTLAKVNMVSPVHFWLLRPTTFRKILWEKK